MNEALALVLTAVGGVLLGAVFFGGLWWTVQKGLAARQPAFWFVGSLSLRMAVALAGFYLAASGGWRRLLACLVGFVFAQLLVTRLTSSRTNPEARRAPHP
jgi:F1F0 ATPase subunit 2